MSNQVVNRRIVLSRNGIVLNDITKAWVSQVVVNGGSVTDLEKLAVNNYTNSIQTSEFDRLWIHGLQNEIAAKTSVINPTSAIITNVNSTTFTPGFGFTGNGANMYLRTGYNPSANGVNFTLNSSGLFVYSRTNSSGVKIDLSAIDGGSNSTYLYTRSVVNDEDLNFNNSTNLNGPPMGTFMDSSGLIGGFRTSSTNITSYRNGITTGSKVCNSSGITNAEVWLLCYNNNGSPLFFSDRQLSLSCICSGNVNALSFYNSTQLLATNLGFNV